LHIPCSKKKHFAALQKEARKHVERYLGVLQARFTTVKGPGMIWNKENLHTIMTTCIILQNMIVEDKNYGGSLVLDTALGHVSCDGLTTKMDTTLSSLIKEHQNLQSVNAHYQLHNNMSKHLWQRKGE
jgi:hypothetical protein